MVKRCNRCKKIMDPWLDYCEKCGEVLVETPEDQLKCNTLDSCLDESYATILLKKWGPIYLGVGKVRVYFISIAAAILAFCLLYLYGALIFFISIVVFGLVIFILYAWHMIIYSMLHSVACITQSKLNTSRLLEYKLRKEEAKAK